MINKELKEMQLDKTVKILTQGKKEEMGRYLNIYYSPRGYMNHTITVARMEDELRAEGRGTIDFEELEIAYISKDTNKLIELLEELFLEEVIEWDIGFMYRYITNTDKLKLLHDYAKYKQRFLASIMEI